MTNHVEQMLRARIKELELNAALPDEEGVPAMSDTRLIQHEVLGYLPPDLEERANQIRSALAGLHRDYQRMAEPYIKALAILEELREPSKFVVMLENYQSGDTSLGPIA